MQSIPGTRSREKWRHMSWLKKQLLVRKIVEYQVQLFRRRFHQVGNLYLTGQLQALSTANIPGTTLPGIEHRSDSSQFCLTRL